MPWSTIAACDVEDEILPDEQTILHTIQGSSGVLGAILTNVVNEVRAMIRVGGNNLDVTNTVPDQLRGDIIAIARWRWFSSVPQTDLLSESRKAQYETAIARLKEIASSKPDRERVEFPAAIPGGPAGQMQQASGGKGHGIKGMGGAI